MIKCKLFVRLFKQNRLFNLWTIERWLHFSLYIHFQLKSKNCRLPIKSIWNIMWSQNYHHSAFKCETHVPSNWLGNLVKRNFIWFFFVFSFEKRKIFIVWICSVWFDHWNDNFDKLKRCWMNWIEFSLLQNVWHIFHYTFDILKVISEKVNSIWFDLAQFNMKKWQLSDNKGLSMGFSFVVVSSSVI